jgi:hypothetical protein
MSDSTVVMRLDHIRPTGYTLNELLNLLYVPPPNPDIITREDVLTRYRLTGFAAPAITALQQAQRIVRSGKDYCQIGLCEFHIGLIYLHWGHCLAAAQQFGEARRQWLFADESAAVCLSYLAEGEAQQFAFHYETAMGCYHKAEQWLPRLRLRSPSESLDKFVGEIADLLRRKQESLRDRMWPLDKEEAAGTAPPAAERAERPSPEAEAVEQPAATAETAVPPPRLNIVMEPATPEASEGEFSSLHNVPLPFVPPETVEPAAVVVPVKEYYRWFRVVERQGDFMPSIREGAWLLVDVQVRERYESNDLILIGSDHDEVRGNIQVEPTIAPPIHKRIVLRRVPPDEFPFTRDKSGRVTFKLPSMTFVVGVVLGFWLNPVQASQEIKGAAAD